MPRNRSEKDPFGNLPKWMHAYARVRASVRVASDVGAYALADVYRSERDAMWETLTFAQRTTWYATADRLPLITRYCNQLLHTEFAEGGPHAT